MGCCDNDSPVNFSLLTMYDSGTIQLASGWLWTAIIFIHFAPYVRPCICLWNRRPKRRSTSPVSAIYTITSLHLVALLAMVLSFHYGTENQPFSETLLSNQTLFVGYILLVTGVGHMIKASLNLGWKVVLGGDLVSGDVQPQPREDFMPYYHPFGTGWVLCLLGCSLLRASVAGLLYAALLALGYYLAYLIERPLLEAPQGEALWSVLGKAYPWLTGLLARANSKVMAMLEAKHDKEEGRGELEADGAEVKVDKEVKVNEAVVKEGGAGVVGAGLKVNRAEVPPEGMDLASDSTTTADKQEDKSKKND